MKIQYECCRCGSAFDFKNVVQGVNSEGHVTFMCLECAAKLELK